MGTKMGPKYACLFLGYVEEKMLITYPDTNPIMSGGYIDDYLGISTLTKIEQENVLLCVKDYHPSLSYENDVSVTSVNVLDISISMAKHGLTTEFFYKETDAHSYHRYQSAHRPSCKEKYSLFTVSRITLDL